MAREWAIDAYKSRLDSAIKRESWEEVDRIRVAGKRRLIEMVASGASEDQVAEARDALTDSFDRLRLSKRIRIEQGALAIATRLSADIETAGIATELAPMPQDTARNARERIIEILSSGNRRARTTSELAEETGYRVETIARAIGQLRAEGRILSRRFGRSVLHRVVLRQRDPLRTIHNLIANSSPPRAWHSDMAVRIAEDLQLTRTASTEGGDGVDVTVDTKRGMVFAMLSKPAAPLKLKLEPQQFDSEAKSPQKSVQWLEMAAQKMRKKDHEEFRFCAP